MNSLDVATLLPTSGKKEKIEKSKVSGDVFLQRHQSVHKRIAMALGAAGLISMASTASAEEPHKLGLAAGITTDLVELSSAPLGGRFAIDYNFRNAQNKSLFCLGLEGVYEQALRNTVEGISLPRPIGGGAFHLALTLGKEWDIASGWEFGAEIEGGIFLPFTSSGPVDQSGTRIGIAPPQQVIPMAGLGIRLSREITDHFNISAGMTLEILWPHKDGYQPRGTPDSWGYGIIPDISLGLKL